MSGVQSLSRFREPGDYSLNIPDQSRLPFPAKGRQAEQSKPCKAIIVGLETYSKQPPYRVNH